MSTGEVRVTDPRTGGQKGTKPERFSLLPWDAVAEVARVFGYGARKYASHNWLRGYNWSLSSDALYRHLASEMNGEERDPESGLLHLAHAACHCLFLITFKLRGLGTDDRAPVSKDPPTGAPAQVTVPDPPLDPRWPVMFPPPIRNPCMPGGIDLNKYESDYPVAGDVDDYLGSLRQ